MGKLEMGIEMNWAMYTYAVVTVMHVSSDTCTICMVYWTAGGRRVV